MKSTLAATVIALFSLTPAAAHEFWIEPLAYAVPSGASLLADIRVGENMVGSAYAYIPRNFERFDIVTGQTVSPVPGRTGDRPALRMPAPRDGLAVVVHQTRDYTLTYDDWDQFQSFVRHKDFGWAIDQHLERGLPRTGFVEAYSRYGKSLIAVGNGAGRDREVGLLTEIVAEANPYTDNVTGGFPVQVLYNGDPRANTQIELFERLGSGEATATLHRTDGQGRAVLPVKPGHEYLVDSVVMRAVVPQAEDGPVWESLWASLTFRVPQ